MAFCSFRGVKLLRVLDDGRAGDDDNGSTVESQQLFESVHLLRVHQQLVDCVVSVVSWRPLSTVAAPLAITDGVTPRLVQCTGRLDDTFPRCKPTFKPVSEKTCATTQQNVKGHVF